MTQPMDPPPPQEAPRKASRTRIVVMLLVGGPILAIGGCALFLANMNSSSTEAMAGLGAIGFIGGALAFVVGVVWGLVRFVNSRFNRFDQTK